MTWREACAVLDRAFTDAGLPEAAADARVLVEEATGWSRAAALMAAATPIGLAAATALEGYARKRLAREPVFRIIGRRQFWGLDLTVTPDVLDPRPDSETIVAAAVEAVRDRRDQPLRVLDLGTGSGALLCAILTELPRARGTGVDRSPAACGIARANVAACRLEDRARIVEGDWTAPVTGCFDVIVANPPYIATPALAGLDPEVRDHDPRLALDGGADGLAAYRAICAALPDVLARDGVAVFEVGFDQADAVAGLLRASGLMVARIVRDLGGHQRAVVAHRPMRI